MISSLCMSLIWCALQVSLIVVIAIGLSKLASQWNLVAARSIVCRSAIACILLTLLAPLPVHHLFAPPAITNSGQPAPALKMTAAANETGNPVNSIESPNVPMINLHDLVNAVRATAVNVEQFETQNKFALRCAFGIIMGTVVIGLLRLMTGIAFVRQIRRSGIALNDPNLLSLVRSLASSLKCRLVPELRESSAVGDAAIAGLIRPMLILPCDWRQWTDDERKVVIAHELAHLVQSDSRWRAAASAFVAIHFYNPLAHWLLRRVVLYQELSADALAAEAVGRSMYLRSLSQLAIRKDDRIRHDACAGCLPVFSGYLMRRITILHSREGRMAMRKQGNRTFGSAMISATFLVMGLTALATRGIAQSPNEASKTDAKTLKPVSFTSRRPAAADSADPAQGMFQRRPLAWSTMGANNSVGMAVVRVQELLRRPDVKPYAPAIDAFSSVSLAGLLSLKSAPPINLDSVEWIAVRPVVTFTPETKDKKSQFMVGSGGLTFKLNQQVDLQQWFDKFAPDARRYKIEGKDVFQLSAHALGPIPACVWTPDGTTIRIGLNQPSAITSETTLADLDYDPVADRVLKNSATESQIADQKSSKWSETWDRADSGLISVVIARADLSGLIIDLDNKPDFKSEFATQAGQVLRAMRERCTDSAFGLDLGESNSRIGLKCRFTHSSRESALQSAQEIQELLRAAASELKKVRETLKNEGEKATDELKVVSVGIEVLSTSTTVSVDELEEGTAAAVVTTAIPFASFLEIAMLVQKFDSVDE